MTLDDAAKSAVERAQAEWAAPHQPSWYALHGLGWTSCPQWCGAFAAYCWQALHPKLRHDLFPSTYRLSLFAQYGNDANLWKPRQVNGVPIRQYHRDHGGLRLFANDAAAAQPGDIIITGAGKYGSHITLCVESSAAGIACISGNGYGIRKNGSTGPGVVKNLYRPDQIRFVIRPAPADLDGTLVYSP